MDAIKGTEPTKLISVFYGMLLLPSSTRLAYGIKPRWEADIGVIEDEEWREALDTCKVVSLNYQNALLNYIYCTAHISPPSDLQDILKVQ